MADRVHGLRHMPRTPEAAPTLTSTAITVVNRSQQGENRGLDYRAGTMAASRDLRVAARNAGFGVQTIMVNGAFPARINSAHHGVLDFSETTAAAAHTPHYWDAMLLVSPACRGCCSAFIPACFTVRGHCVSNAAFPAVDFGFIFQIDSAVRVVDLCAVT